MRLQLFLLIALLAACDQSAQSGVDDSNLTQQQGVLGSRWYSEQQVLRGAEVFGQHCAQCHGAKAEGLADDWRVRLDDGSFPPPPLDGSAHAWHHPRAVLLQVINEGGVSLGGKMPSFETVLDEQDKLAAIAYFQDFWSDEIYSNWMQMGGVN